MPLQDDSHIDGAPFASQNKRLVNFLVDSFATQIVASVADFVLGIVYGIANGGQISESQAAMLNLIGMLTGLIVVLMYFFLLEAFTGVTVGKLLTGTRVVNATGGKPSFGQCLGRTFSRMIPFEPFSFLFGDNTTGWHDSLSGTRVVDMRAARR